MRQEIIYKSIFVFFVTFLLVTFLMPLVKKIAFHIGAIDMPNARKVHSKPIPRLGGLGIYAGFIIGYLLFFEPDSLMNSILIGSFFIVMTGVIDDIKPISPKAKIFGQLIAAIIVVCFGGVVLREIDALGIYLNFGIFSYPISIFFIIACINCVNLIDGLDGLSGGICAIFYMTVIVILFARSNLGLEFLLSIIMLASTLGFLVHNFFPASIFSGDSGSMFQGYIISIIAILGFKNVTVTSFLIPIILLAIPFLDAFFAILRRSIKGEKITCPDKMHIHHQLLSYGLSQRTVVLIIYGIDLLFSIGSIMYVLVKREIGYAFYMTVFILTIVFVLKTSIIFEHNKHKD